MQLPTEKRKRAKILAAYMKRERLSTRGAARLWGVSQTTIRRWLNPDLYPAHEGRDSRRKYSKSAKGKAAGRRYQQSDKGKETIQRTLAKQRSTIEGRIKTALATQKVWAKKNGVKPCHTSIEIIAAAYRDVCPLCTLESRKMVIDHDHETGDFRGWICRQCNMCLGLIQENPDTLNRMKGYLA